MSDPRKTAASALLKVESEMAYSNITLNACLTSANLDAKGKAFATALFYGVLERKITLDFCLQALVKTPLKKVAPFTLQVMRLGAYQIMFMDKVPASAAVNESVKLIKNSKEYRNAGFVNAVLRNLLRTLPELPKDSSIHSLSVRYSCPENIIEGFISDYGIETACEILKASVLPAKTYIRVNVCKTTADSLFEKLKSEGIDAQKTEIENCLQLFGADINESNAYKDGLFHVQDTASQSCALLLAAKSGEHILDMCASPGGKTFTVSETALDKCYITACDIYEKRVGLISKGAERLGLKNIKTAVSDAAVFNESLGVFDAILCDVPCSGFGVLGRKPEIKYKKEDYTELSKIQYKILSNAVNYLKSGGRILYSTCTLRKSENDCNIQQFLTEHKNFKLVYEHTYFPHTDNTDGFYAALLVRQD